jgi:hypothetical protein
MAPRRYLTMLAALLCVRQAAAAPQNPFAPMRRQDAGSLAAPVESRRALAHRRRLAPEDFTDINRLLGRISIQLPTVATTTLGLYLQLINLTCTNMAVSEITLSTYRVDARTFDVRPNLIGVNASCLGGWSYTQSTLGWSGGGTVGIAATGASLSATVRIIPLDFDVVTGEGGVLPPSSPPVAQHATPCQASSGCNFPCGETPGEFAAANLLAATPQQCYCARRPRPCP